MPRGDVFWYFHIYVALAHFGGSTFRISTFLEFSEKKYFFFLGGGGGVEGVMKKSWRSSQNWTIFVVHLDYYAF